MIDHLTAMTRCSDARARIARDESRAVHHADSILPAILAVRTNTRTIRHASTIARPR